MHLFFQQIKIFSFEGMQNFCVLHFEKLNEHKGWGAARILFLAKIKTLGKGELFHGDKSKPKKLQLWVHDFSRTTFEHFRHLSLLEALRH